MRKGRITIPTDENYVEGTKKIADLWGADAVRDCDGVKLPKNPKEIADKVWCSALGNDGSPILSMGMSESFEEAIECGATLVRVGRTLFHKE